jgi:uncharacterized protein YdeI (YjbR/CyaY-like superfamily)
MNPEVDAYIEQATKWQEEVKALRRIALAHDLNEELKWGLPCYTVQTSNVVIIQEFKEYCALMFFKGVLLQDPQGVLVPPGDSQAARQIRFTSVAQIDELEHTIRSYLDEALAVEKAGLKVAFRETSDFTVPPEFQARLDENPDLQSAFSALAPGRQRAYLHHFSAPKQSTTRASRVEKCVPRILAGKGLDD